MRLILLMMGIAGILFSCDKTPNPEELSKIYNAMKNTSIKGRVAIIERMDIRKIPNQNQVTNYQFYHFNTDGVLIEETRIENAISNKVIYEMEGRIWHAYNAQRQSMGRVIYRYASENNAVVAESYTKNDKLLLKTVYHFDEKGNQIEYGQYATNGEMLFRNVNLYHSDNQLIEQIQFYPDSRFPNRILYDYDTNRHLLRKLALSPDGTTNTISRYKTDQLGNVLEITEMNTSEKSVLQRVALNYDEVGNVIEMRVYDHQNREILTSKQKFEYFKE